MFIIWLGYTSIRAGTEISTSLIFGSSAGAVLKGLIRLRRHLNFFQTRLTIAKNNKLNSWWLQMVGIFVLGVFLREQNSPLDRGDL